MTPLRRFVDGIAPLSRSGWLSVLAIAAVFVGGAAVSRWPSDAPALDCAPQDVRWTDGGSLSIALCAPGTPRGRVPAGAGLTVGVKLELNRATEEELSLLPGIGPKLARELLRAREARGGFQSWDDVDAVEGIGAAKLQTLIDSAELR